MLSDDGKTINAMRNGDPKPFNQMKRTVVSELNSFLTQVAKRSLVLNLQIDFSKAEKTH